METAATWGENKKLLCSLWPKWKPDADLGSILNEKWGLLKQDVLRDCIRQHRMTRDAKPDISAIHKAYCDITSPKDLGGHVNPDIARTREDAERCQPITAEEYAEWDAWAEEVLRDVTNEERAAVPAYLGFVPASRRILAVAVDYLRRNPRR